MPALPGQLPRVLQEVKDPLLRRYFEQTFGVASFYDVLPIPYLGIAAARARGVTFEQQIKDSNRFAARSRFAELYGALIRHVDAETLALALPRAVKILQSLRVHDPGGRAGTRPRRSHRRPCGARAVVHGVDRGVLVPVAREVHGDAARDSLLGPRGGR